MFEAKDFMVEKLGESTLPSPLSDFAFVEDSASVAYERNASNLVNVVNETGGIPAFEMAGPRSKLYHDPAWSRAAILTAGGLCPGLNDVIKFLTLTLKKLYKVPIVYGIRYGYRGLNPDWKLSPIMLTEEFVDDVHELGGSVLGSSRGQENEKVIVETLERMNINMLFCIGGDGTSRCAHDIHLEIKRRGLSISVICVPKTIDNDIAFVDKTFGFETAVHVADTFVTSANSEAKGAYNGIGLVKVMGRDSGFIAAYTALANSYVNYCLVPEVPFSIDEDDPESLLNHLVDRMKKKNHAVIIVAEGAGQELFAKHKHTLKDASGNIMKDDIGLLLKIKIIEHFKKIGMEINLKYFDPSYSIRSVPAHGADAVFCAMLAQNAVHAALSGRTDIVIGHWANEFTHVPISLATSSRKKIEIGSPLWTSVKATTCF